MEWSNVNEARQGWDLDVGTVLHEGDRSHKVKFKIHHDTSYAFQSHAKVSVWMPEKLEWSLVATVDWQVWAEDTSPASFEYHAANRGTAGMWEAFEELDARARAILF